MKRESCLIMKILPKYFAVKDPKSDLRNGVA